MSDKNDNHLTFGQWLQDRRIDLRLDEEAMAERIGASVATYVMWEVGNTKWETLPGEYKRKIESVCGKYLANGEVHGMLNQEHTPRPGSANSPELVVRKDQIYISSFAESFCAKCGAPVLISDDGRCRNCGTSVDGGL